MRNYSFEEMVDRIKQTQKVRKISNIELSEKSGIPIGTLNKILNGDTKAPQLPTVAKISETLEVSANYIIFGEECRPDLPSGEGLRIGRLYDKASLKDKAVVETVLREYDEDKKGAPAANKVEKSQVG